MKVRVLFTLLTLLIAMGLTYGAVAAQTPPGGAGTPLNPPDVSQMSPVTLDGEILFRLPGITAYTSDRRAEDTSRAILALAKDPNYRPGMLQVQQQEGFIRISQGERLIISVTDLDAAAEQLAAPLLAQVIVKRIDEAVQKYRDSRQPGVLVRDTLTALAILAAFMLALIVAVRAFRYAEQRGEEFYKDRMSRSPARGLGTTETQVLWLPLRNTIYLIRTASILIVALVALNAILALFPWTAQYSRRALQLLLGPLSTMATNLFNSIPDFAFLFVLYFVTKLLLRVTQMFFAAVRAGSITVAGFYPEWALPTYGLVRTIIISFALVVGYPYLPGSGSDAFKGISVFLGVIFSLGSSSVIANIVSGYALIYRRSFRIGDYVQIGDARGEVLEVRLQVTTIRTPKNEIVTIPNSQIFNGSITNYSSLARQHRLILHTTVGIGYEIPWRQVEAMLLMAARRTSELLTEPPPFVLQKELGDFAVLYELNVYCDQPHRQPRLYTELHRQILDVFNEYGVQIMTPSYEQDPEVAKVVPKSRWFESPAETLPQTNAGVWQEVSPKEAPEKG